MRRSERDSTAFGVGGGLDSLQGSKPEQLGRNERNGMASVNFQLSGGRVSECWGRGDSHGNKKRIPLSPVVLVQVVPISATDQFSHKLIISLYYSKGSWKVL